MRVKVLEDQSSFVNYAASRIAQIAIATLEVNPTFSLVLTGGSTPGPIYERLAHPNFANAIDWQRVHIFFGDERCVPPDHPDSNFGMAHDTLLQHVPIPDEQIHRLKGELNPQNAASEYESVVRAFLEQNPPGFDLTLLGMGDDGHAASLFPGTNAINEKERWVVAHHVKKLDAWRLTMSPPLLNRSENIMFVVSGSSKAAALHQVIEGDFQPMRYPAQIIRPDNQMLTWVVDSAAAEELTIETE